MLPTRRYRIAGSILLPLALALAVAPASAGTTGAGRAGVSAAAPPTSSPAASSANAAGSAGQACAMAGAGGHLVLRFGKGCTTEQLARALRQAVGQAESDERRGAARGYYRRNGLTGISQAQRLGSSTARP
jgi:hypothetical protein